MTCARIISNMDKLLINTRTFKERKRGYTPKTEKYPENHTKDTVAQRIRQTLGPRDVWVYISALTVLRKSSSLCKKPRSNELLGSDWPQWYHWHKGTNTHVHVPVGYDVFLHWLRKTKNVSVVCALNTISQLIFIWKIIILVLLV